MDTWLKSDELKFDGSSAKITLLAKIIYSLLTNGSKNFLKMVKFSSKLLELVWQHHHHFFCCFYDHIITQNNYSLTYNSMKNLIF